LFTLSLTLLATAALAEEIKLADIFTDHMILQRDLPVAVWGTGPAGDSVTVTFAGQQKIATVDPSGKWQVQLDPLQASADSRDLTVESKNVKTNLTDVVVGEVWLASGQSNMEWPFSATTGSSRVIATATDPQLRLFGVAHYFSDTPGTTVTGQWAACTSSNVGGFSAVGYYFGRNLRQALHVPVGVIRSAWGGTQAQAWTAQATLAGDPLLKQRLEEYALAMQNYDPVKAEAQYQDALAKFKVAAATAQAEGKPAPRSPSKSGPPGPGPNSPARLYNGMIAPLVPFAFRGVIWYQGEADASRAQDYRTLFPAMIKNWRQVFSHDFPFLFVQIAPHKGMPPEIRDAQLYTWPLLPITATPPISIRATKNPLAPGSRWPPARSRTVRNSNIPAPSLTR